MPPIAVSVEKLSKSYNDKELFEKVTFGIDQGQKVALVGVNGCGKSTLLNIISGKDKQDEGLVSFQKGLKVSYLAQSPDLDAFDTVLDSIFDPNHPESKLLGEYWELVEKEEPTMADQSRVEYLISEIDGRNAWDYEYKLKEILDKLGITDLNQKISSMSGGQKKRIALAKALLDDPEFLILDEPTNHLDLNIIEWLEDYLSSQNLSILMVTHDRYFLDKVCNEIIEIDRGQIFKYKGNYSYYLEKKAEQESINLAEKDKAKNLLSKELDWMRRQPKARGTKSKSRIEAFYETEKKANVDLSRQNMEIKLSGRRQGKKILELKKISKAWGDKSVFKNFSHVFARGEKIGVVGQNGTGKSTFLNVLTGEIKPDEGTIEQGLNTVFGYYHQHTIEEDPGKKVIDVISEIADSIELEDGNAITASQLLNQFLFPPKTQYSHVSKLSGGEKRRLQLLKVLITNPNFLILDEPTNDLDIVTLNVLEDYLDNFPGCLLVVSHDRYFMDRLVDHLFVLDETDEIQDFPGNYTDFRFQLEEKKKEKVDEKSDRGVEKVKSEEKRKLSYAEKLEFETLESDIEKLNKRKAEFEEKMNSGETDHAVLTEWSNELLVINDEIDSKELRWLELSEISQ
ncbi:ABC-F family ATP-binding cassette domain-containing protein [Reichenbachiella agarivorans]|uniref:ABC-F family ATP-binding cassette domain-containing protein n=1 Tax=Reichenbachiella agarivorans TaxID=2979464 RepID=A0ABY6CXF6_9BACT|nr:ABC-F family ATP-binding cassette domain-containing protein [Reichenbachiella agarivorans]UXP34078.1 ABC-F family ATP-binding cassette domain-containing protein [Reichenbachiella agarivorans]